MNKQCAFFVRYPRRMNDLMTPHPLEAEKPFQIIEEVKLSHIDYENFSEDLLADRAFLERYHSLHTRDGALQCLLIHDWNQSDGILVVPQNGFVLSAAMYVKEKDKE